jgi:hypothetical protein
VTHLTSDPISPLLRSTGLVYWRDGDGTQHFAPTSGRQLTGLRACFARAKRRRSTLLRDPNVNRPPKNSKPKDAHAANNHV